MCGMKDHIKRDQNQVVFGKKCQSMECVIRYGCKDGAGCGNVLVKLTKVTQWFSNGKTEQTVQRKGLGFFLCVIVTVFRL